MLTGERRSDMKLEILTENEDGQAIPGRVVEVPEMPEVWRAATYGLEPKETITTHKEKFYQVDATGFGMVPGTLVTFLVPDQYMEPGEFGKRPSQRALDLVTDRMGWH